MNSDNRFSRDRSSAPGVRSRELPQAPKSFGLSLDADPIKPAKPERSSDPYNTSGSFDRTKNWTRVGKR